MNLLAIDTTDRLGGIALTQDGQILEAVSLEAPDGFGEIIYSEIETLLSRNNVALREIDGYAAAAGPGSFTGVRVGLSVVKSLAEVHGKEVAPVSSLRALAYSGTGTYRVAVINARRQEVYVGVYDEHLALIVEEVVTEWESFRVSLGNRPVTFVSLDQNLFERDGAARQKPDSTDTRETVIIGKRPLSIAVAHVAKTLFETGQSVAPEAVDANYIRRPEAELKWKDPD